MFSQIITKKQQVLSFFVVKLWWIDRSRIPLRRGLPWKFCTERARGTGTGNQEPGTEW